MRFLLITQFLALVLAAAAFLFASASEICDSATTKGAAVSLGCDNCEGLTCMYILTCCNKTRMSSILDEDPLDVYTLDDHGCFISGGVYFCVASTCVHRIRIRVDAYNPAFSLGVVGRTTASSTCGNMLLILTYDEEATETLKNPPEPRFNKKIPMESTKNNHLILPLSVGVGVVVVASVVAVVFFICRMRRQSSEKKIYNERMEKAKHNLIWYIGRNKDVMDCVGQKPHPGGSMGMNVSGPPQEPPATSSVPPAFSNPRLTLNNQPPRLPASQPPASVHSHKSCPTSTAGNSYITGYQESLLYDCRKTLTAESSAFDSSNQSVLSAPSRVSSRHVTGSKQSGSRPDVTGSKHSGSKYGGSRHSGSRNEVSRHSKSKGSKQSVDSHVGSRQSVYSVAPPSVSVSINQLSEPMSASRTLVGGSMTDFSSINSLGSALTRHTLLAHENKPQ